MSHCCNVNVAVLLLFTIFVSVQSTPLCVRTDGTTWAGYLNVNPVNCVAHGDTSNSLNTTGWHFLKLATNASYSDEDQAFSAGFFEGFATYETFMIYWNNVASKSGVFPMNDNLNNFYAQNMAFMQRMVSENNRSDPYWYNVGLMLMQFNGMLRGFAQAKPAGGMEVTLTMLMAVASLPDSLDLSNVFPPPHGFRRFSRAHPFDDDPDRILERSHCSALVKISPNFDEIWFGHATWFFFSTMTRVFRSFTLNFSPLAQNAAKTIQYSSFPGAMSSTDDFFLLSSGLYTSETTLNVYNMSIYKGNISPNTLMVWMRAMVANRMSKSGKEWMRIFSLYNSGTYNSQWTVLDLNLFTPGKKLPPGLIYVLEQMPGMIQTADVTELLSYGYYPSYNVPSLEPLSTYSGNTAAAAEHPTTDDYSNCVRAKLFKKLQTTVHDIESFKYVLRYNHFQTDPLQLQDPTLALSARGDLRVARPSAFGAIDCKVSSYSMWKSGMLVSAVAGPTTQQSPFAFSTFRGKMPPHAGMPDLFNFSWVTIDPRV